jgi:hypothetical protein
MDAAICRQTELGTARRPGRDLAKEQPQKLADSQRPFLIEDRNTDPQSLRTPRDPGTINNDPLLSIRGSDLAIGDSEPILFVNEIALIVRSAAL